MDGLAVVTQSLLREVFGIINGFGEFFQAMAYKWAFEKSAARTRF